MSQKPKKNWRVLCLPRVCASFHSFPQMELPFEPSLPLSRPGLPFRVPHLQAIRFKKRRGFMFSSRSCPSWYRHCMYCIGVFSKWRSEYARSVIFAGSLREYSGTYRCDVLHAARHSLSGALDVYTPNLPAGRSRPENNSKSAVERSMRLCTYSQKFYKRRLTRAVGPNYAHAASR